MTSAAIRSSFLYVLRDDLVGPDADDPRDAGHGTETLTSAPSHWYLTGFLAPTGQKTEEKEDDEAGADLTSAVDEPADGEAEAPVARRPVFPSSIGLSVLVRAESKGLTVRVTFGTYQPVAPSAPTRAEEAGERRPGASDVPPADELSSRHHWVRTPYDRTIPIALTGKSRFDETLPDSEGMRLRVVMRPVPESELGLVPKGTRYATVFLVNERKPTPRPEQDRGYVFQVKLAVKCAEGFVPRPNLRGARKEDDIDERIGDLHYRDCFEYAVGHGVSAWADVKGQRENVFCERVASTWVPTAEVDKVEASKVDKVELRMAELAKLTDGAALKQVLERLISAYGEWIERQAETDFHGPEIRKETVETREDTAAALLGAAGIARDRIARGLDILANGGAPLEAFCIANDAMAAAQTQREKLKNPEKVKAGELVPEWRPFQLAFLIMNVAGQVEPTDKEREAVDLIFFPTGGGKTEAYLGLAAFTLVLRRLTHPASRRPGSPCSCAIRSAC